MRRVTVACTHGPLTLACVQRWRAALRPSFATARVATKEQGPTYHLAFHPSILRNRTAWQRQTCGTMANDAAAPDSQPTTDPIAELGLPAWLEDMLKPGVGSAVFLTLKLSLVFLVLTLIGLLCVMTDEAIRMHVSIFLLWRLCCLAWSSGSSVSLPPRRREKPKGTKRRRRTSE